MSIPPAKHILIAPLDWGSGHTTRCIPLIRHLRHCGHNVTFAGNSMQETLIRKSFPDIRAVRLEGYNVTYSRHGSGFMPRLMSQVPGLIKTVRSEHRWLKDYVKQHPVDGIISDNRYGLYHDTVPSVIITHQLSLKTGFGRFADGAFRQLHYQFLEKFDRCWVPDVAGKPNLAGSLSHPGKLPGDTQYIGWLSQMSHPAPSSPGEHLLILLSGPEPQRTILSDLLWQQAIKLEQKVVFVEGSTAAANHSSIPEHITYYQLAGAKELQPLVEQASIVICRSGYSTLMDLVLLNKKALLIPTPGQTEQVYLAAHLREQGIFMSGKQSSFHLANGLEEASRFPFHPLIQAGAHRQFVPVLDAWVASLSGNKKASV